MKIRIPLLHGGKVSMKCKGSKLAFELTSWRVVCYIPAPALTVFAASTRHTPQQDFVTIAGRVPLAWCLTRKVCPRTVLAAHAFWQAKKSLAPWYASSACRCSVVTTLYGLTSCFEGLPAGRFWALGLALGAPPGCAFAFAFLPPPAIGGA